MTDFISILRHSTIQLAKTWQADGNISAYQDAKYFSLVKKPVSSIQDLSKVLTGLEADSNACVIRGMYKGDDHAKQVDTEFKQGKVRRQKRLFDDKPHHWVLIEIDDFEPMLADPVLEPVDAINEYIATCLPDCFHEVSYHWQLSNSAGHIKNVGKLKAHVWFWLETAYISDQLKAWAEQNYIALDKSVLNTVQIHYTAAPIFEAGVSDPVPLRSGFVDGLLGDAVGLEIVLDVDLAETSSTTGIEDDFDDPFAGLEPKVGLTLTDAKSLIKFIDNEERQTWLKAGMALHHEFDGADEALALWDTWASTASNYSGFDDHKYRWDGFAQGGQNPVTARWLIKFGKEATKNAENQEKRLAFDEIKAEITECRDDGELINIVAKKAGMIARGDIALKSQIIALIRGQFKSITGATLALPDVRLAMNSGIPAKTRGEDGRHELSELGNVGRMIDRYGDDLMYVPQTDSWYSWNGVYWQPVTQLEILQYATATVKALPNEMAQIKSDEDKAKHKAFFIFSQRVRMVEDMVKWARSDERLLTYVTRLDSEMDFLGCANGVVDLRTGDLLEPDRSHFNTYTTGVEYNPSAKCPVFEQTVLDAFFGDEALAKFFQRVIGYIAMGQPRESLILIPYGSGSNGKSTIFKSIALALGDYAKTANADTFLGDGRVNGGGAREDILRLRGSRYVYSTEPEEGKELKEGLIKTMTGGEALPARGLYSRHTIEVQPTWTVVMPTNHKPIIKGDDYGIWRRLLLIPFTRNYDKDTTIKKDVNRSAKLLKELPGILRWIVQGALDYQKYGLEQPKKVLQAKEDYKQDNDLLLDWISDCCVLEEGYQESNRNLWQSWQTWAIANGRQHMFKGEPSFGKKLKGKFANWRTATGRGYIGIRVVKSAEFADLEEK